MFARSISFAFVLLLAFAQLGQPCSMCSPNFQQATTLRQSARQARFIVIGTLSNPRRTADMMGTTDVNVELVLKSDPAIAQQKILTVPTYVPLDPKGPNRFIVLGDFINGKIEVIQGRPVNGPEMAAYLKASLQIDDRDRLTILQLCYKHLDDPDPEVANDAFHEFAKANDLEIAALAGKLDPAKVRKFLNDPKTPSDRIGIFAYLLGACGAKEDAPLLAALINKNDERGNSALSGLLGGLIELSPEQGWTAVQAILRDPKRPFMDKLAVIATLRFCHVCKPKQYNQEIMRGLAAILEQGDLADQAVEDLRRWQQWDLTRDVLAQYAKPTHAAPLVRGSIIRYALSCPQPEAVQFVAALRQTQPDLVKNQEDGLRRLNAPRGNMTP